MRIAVTGTPATGKTSVAKILAEKLGFRYINLNKFAKEKKLFSGYDRKRKCNVVDIEKMRKEIKKIQEDLVMDSHYSHEMPFDVVVVLRTNPRELRKRMERKGWWKEKIEENIEAEIMEICKSEALERLGNKKMIEIQTTRKKPEDVVKEIMEKLRE